MKNRILIIAIAMVSLLVVGCGTGEKTVAEAPEVVAEKFEKALFTADFESAKQMCTENGKARVSAFSELFGTKAEQMKQSTPSIDRQMYETDDANGKSTAEFIITNSINPSTGEIYRENLFTTVRLIKNEQGHWKVDSF